MKEILIRLLLAALLTLAAFALSSSARAEQAAAQQDSTSRSEVSRDPQTPAAAPVDQNDARAAASSSGDDQTQNALVFTGQIEQEKGALVLIDPVAKVTYQLNDQMRAKRFVGKQVRVIGKLEMKSNTIHVDTINPAR